jgi:hypothetical protein
MGIFGNRRLLPRISLGARSNLALRLCAGRDPSVQKSKKMRESCSLSAIIGGGDGC